MKKITIAGTILTDIVKMIDVYPQKGMLTNITSVRQSVGGCVPNTGISLKRLDPSVSVKGVGSVSSRGAFIIRTSADKNNGVAALCGL